MPKSLVEMADEGLPLDDALIIDCHTHLTSAEKMIAEMDKIGKSFKIIMSGKNDSVADAVRRYPERFIGSANVDLWGWSDSAKLVDELDRCFDELGMAMIGELNHEYPIDGPNMLPILEYANSKGLTMLIHGFWGGGGCRNAEVIGRLSQKYSKANFICAHVGFEWDGITTLRWDESPTNKYVEVAKERPNVYLDTCSSIHCHRILETVLKDVPVEKILFGSDLPGHSLAPMVGMIIYSNISDQDKRKILGLNIAKLLNLE